MQAAISRHRGKLGPPTRESRVPIAPVLRSKSNLVLHVLDLDDLWYISRQSKQVICSPDERCWVDAGCDLAAPRQADTLAGGLSHSFYLSHTLSLAHTQHTHTHTHKHTHTRLHTRVDAGSDIAAPRQAGRPDHDGDPYQPRLGRKGALLTRRNYVDSTQVTSPSTSSSVVFSVNRGRKARNPEVEGLVTRSLSIRPLPSEKGTHSRP